MELIELELRNKTLVISSYVVALALALIYIGYFRGGYYLLGVASSGYALSYIFHLAYNLKINEKD